MISSFFGEHGIYQEGDLTSVDQEGPDQPVKGSFLGEVETAVRLGMKFLVGDMGSAQVTLFWDYSLLLTSQNSWMLK